ncbi:Hypothetical predicted protein, partial [Pelobates cultripes]
MKDAELYTPQTEACSWMKGWMVGRLQLSQQAWFVLGTDYRLTGWLCRSCVCALPSLALSPRLATAPGQRFGGCRQVPKLSHSGGRPATGSRPAGYPRPITGAGMKVRRVGCARQSVPTPVQ